MDFPAWGAPLAPLGDLCISRAFLETLPTRPLDHARRVRFERHVGGWDQQRLEAAVQVLFPRSTAIRLFGSPAGFVFGRQGVEPSILSSPGGVDAAQHRLGLHLASMWLGEATLPEEIAIWSAYQPFIVSLSLQRDTPAYHAAIGFASEPRRLPSHWYSWVPARRPFVARHSLRDLVGGHQVRGAPIVSVYRVQVSTIR